MLFAPYVALKMSHKKENDDFSIWVQKAAEISPCRSIFSALSLVKFFNSPEHHLMTTQKNQECRCIFPVQTDRGSETTT